MNRSAVRDDRWRKVWNTAVGQTKNIKSKLSSAAQVGEKFPLVQEYCFISLGQVIIAVKQQDHVLIRIL